MKNLRQLFSKSRIPRHAARAALLVVVVALVAAPQSPLPGGPTEGEDAARVVDLSLLVAPDYPCTWPTFPPFQINHYRRIGPLSAYNCDILVIDGNTGTQLDVPPHSVTPPKSGLPNAGRFGLSSTEKIPAWQFGGEACVIDCKELLDTAPDGRSDLIKKELVQRWEKKNRPLGPGDVVLFH